MRARKVHKPRTALHLQRLVTVGAAGQVWTFVFEFDFDWTAHLFKVWNVIIDYNHQHLASRVERRMGASDVITMLGMLVNTHGAPPDTALR